MQEASISEAEIDIFGQRVANSCVEAAIDVLDLRKAVWVESPSADVDTSDTAVLLITAPIAEFAERLPHNQVAEYPIVDWLRVDAVAKLS